MEKYHKVENRNSNVTIENIIKNFNEKLRKFNI
jgi:hypothetical protein